MLTNRLRELVAIKARRERRTITQRDIAGETGLALSTISRWMCNRADRFDSPTLVALCDYLDCEVGDLLIIEETPADETGQAKTPLAATA